MSVNKSDSQGEEPRKGSSPPLLARVIGSIAWYVLWWSPVAIIWVVMMATMWGAGTRMITEAFEWGWNLFGF